MAAFVALAIATVAAFFFTQHLKVTTPLLAGFPAPAPAAINPVDGQVCRTTGPKGTVRPVSHKSMFVSFYLLNRSDDVDVYIVNNDGTIVRTLASGVHMQGGRHPVRRTFSWDGRLADGTVAADGNYFIRVSLVHQGRTVLISNSSGALPVTVETVPPRPRVTDVTPALIPQPSSSGGAVTIRATGTKGLNARVLIYRTDLPGRPVLVKSYASGRRTHHALGRHHQGPPGTRRHLSGGAQGDRPGLQHRPLSARTATRPRNHGARRRDRALPGRRAAADRGPRRHQSHRLRRLAPPCLPLDAAPGGARRRPGRQGRRRLLHRLPAAGSAARRRSWPV